MNASPDNPPPPSRRYRIMQALMWPVMKLLGLSCRHYAELCGARLDRPLSTGENVRFRIHGLICGLCRPLPKHFESLRELTRCASCQPVEENGPSEPLDSEVRDRILQAITEKVNADENAD